MTSRILPRAEYDRLAGTEIAAFAAILPDDARVLVVEDADGVIVGAWSTFLVRHLEGVWIAPAHRGKGSVARRLWCGMRALVRELGSTVAATSSQDADLSALLVKHGAVPLDGDHFSVRMEDVCRQP